MWRTNLAKYKDFKYIKYNGYKKNFLGVNELGECVVLSTYAHVRRLNSTHASSKREIKASVTGKTSREIRIGNTSMEDDLDTQQPWTPLYDMTFYRIMLNEAHRMRNVRATQFKATLQFNTRRRIACNGTIFNNDYTDVGAILTFLRYQPLVQCVIFRPILPQSEDKESK